MRRKTGLTIAERNALILFTKGAKKAAAEALGWKPSGPTDRSYDGFMEEEITRIREKVNGRRRVQREPAPAPAPAPPVAHEEEEQEMNDDDQRSTAPAHSAFEEGTIARLEGRIAELDEELAPYLPQFLERQRLIDAKRILEGPRAETPEPERLDEREAQPLPPPGEKLDEREPDPPPPGAPPVREDEPEDAAPTHVPTLEECRDWVVQNKKDGSPWKAGELQEAFPALTIAVRKARLDELRDLGIISLEGERGGARWRYVIERPGAEAPTRPHTRNGNGHGPGPEVGDLAPPRGLPVKGTGKRTRRGLVGRTPA